MTVSCAAGRLSKCEPVRGGSVEVTPLQSCWDFWSLEVDVPKALPNLYNKWQLAPPGDFVVWKYLSVYAGKDKMGLCNVLSFSWCFTISLLFRRAEDAPVPRMPNKAFLFFPSWSIQKSQSTAHQKPFRRALTTPFPLPKGTVYWLISQ